jgi:Pectate lyase superfamily protein
MMIPRRKRLLAAPDEIRRASLIAAPIALFGGNATLADTAFTKFSFPATGARANRTMPDRLSDIVNVKDYGAYGDWPNTGYHDDTAAIQAALTAASKANGGIVFFPAGKYLITSTLTVPDSTANLKIIGCGGNENADGGTVITGNFNGWLLSTQQMNNAHSPVRLIEGIAFQNQNTTAPVSTDVTPGCIRIVSGIAVQIRNCGIGITSGIGIFMGVQNSIVTNTNITGHYPAHTSYGVWTNGSVENCKIQGCSIGIINGVGAGVVRNIDIEVSGTGILINYNPIPYYDSNQSYPPLQPAQTGSANVGVYENISMESCNGIFINIVGAHYCTFQSIQLASFAPIGTPTDGILIDPYCHYSRFSNIYIAGAFSHAAFGMGQQVGGCVFDTVRALCTGGGGANWVLPIAAPGDDPFIVTNCQGFSGAIPFATRSTAPTAWGMTSVFSDSVDPVWTGSASNVGKPIKGGGTHTVLGRWDGRQWVIAG